MTTTQTAGTAAQTNPLTASFPAELRSEVTIVTDLIRPSAATHPGSSVVVRGESLNIPYRIHHDCDDTLFLGLNEVQAAIYACALTRHHDGHVRQRHVERLVTSPEPWVAPFVVHLCGEYVVEILAVIEASLPSMDQHVYGVFFQENPTFLKRTHDRMVSYWDCYYRWLYKRKTDYVGFRIFEQFDAWRVSA
ncbi:hypothetical protein LFL96_09360 [Paraburkholderia sp. D15]|uniref:hypothetical protein n=1 Tax=Paraburkholderia sp. D15 TaxID=2880218 RepID=UPI00247ADACF|nr:hypothetical protein [Paraburkholderia sp. D15]WGS51681.1 hypothetical protein LFL96_09360 [Paraburkholderia sp. D15]WKF55889.1 hypothetical protein HUO10_000333 [Paraburkholderia busanensis]